MKRIHNRFNPLNESKLSDLKFLTGFTLIELLVVVAIIAILAAIAIPNYLTAQVRSKVSRAKGEMQTLATALESYEVDNNAYPLMRGSVVSGPQVNRDEDTNGYEQTCTQGFRTVPIELTTPIAYLTSLPDDPFKNPGFDVPWNENYDSQDPLDRGYVYTNVDEFVDSDSPITPYNPNNYGEPAIISYGDWRMCSIGPDVMGVAPIGTMPYDPTNGLVSNGDIIRTQRSPDGSIPAH